MLHETGETYSCTESVGFIAAQVASLVRAAGMSDRADAIAKRPGSDTLTPAAKQLGFWIASGRGTPHVIAALRQVARFADDIGCGQSVRNVIGKSFAEAARDTPRVATLCQCASAAPSGGTCQERASR